MEENNSEFDEEISNYEEEVENVDIANDEQNYNYLINESLFRTEEAKDYAPLYGVPPTKFERTMGILSWISFILFVCAGIWALFTIILKRLSKVKKSEKIIFVIIVLVYVIVSLIRWIYLNV